MSPLNASILHNIAMYLEYSVGEWIQLNPGGEGAVFAQADLPAVRQGKYHTSTKILEFRQCWITGIDAKSARIYIRLN